ncbi:MAG TPA: hypothetical protein VGG02_02805 [Chthoniobacterales bacterium]|jgi:hypothetical protein
MKPILFVLALATVFGCAGCAGDRNYRAIDQTSPTGARRCLELRYETQVATLHFPNGTYELAAEDDAGFFYHAPAKILENTVNGPLFLDGGLYLPKSGRRALRGYIYWYGGLVHVGNLARASYLLRD